MTFKQDVQIDPTAIVLPNVELGSRTIVEPFCLIGLKDRFHPDLITKIGKDSFLGSRCTIYSGVIAGAKFDISDQTTIFFDNQFGDNCRIGPKAVIKNGCRLQSNVRVNAQVFMERVEIDSFVFIGPGTVFTDDIHPPCPRYTDCTGKTLIESHVSIGANVTVGPGIRIGHHSQVYAGSVLIRDVEPYSVMAGNPAVLVKDFRDLRCHPGYFESPYEWWE